MSVRRAMAWSALVLAFVLAGWVVPWAVTEPGSQENQAAVDQVEVLLSQPVRRLLTVGYDAYVVSDPERRRLNGCEPDRELRRVVARTWWFIPLTTYETGCGPTSVIGGL